MTIFSSSKSVFAAAALAVAGIAGLNATSGHAGEFSSATVVKPKAGLSFPVGSKQAVGYFLAERGGCDLTLLVGEAGEAAQAAFDKAQALLGRRPAPPTLGERIAARASEIAGRLRK